MCGSHWHKGIWECKGIQLLCLALRAESEIHVAGSGFARPHGWVCAEHMCNKGAQPSPPRFPDIIWLCLSYGMVKQKRDSAILQMKVHHLEELYCFPAYTHISSSVMQCPPQCWGSMCLRSWGISSTHSRLDEKRQQSSLYTLC